MSDGLKLSEDVSKINLHYTPSNEITAICRRDSVIIVSD